MTHDVQKTIDAYHATTDSAANVIHRSGFMLGLAMRPNDVLTQEDRLMIARAASSLANYADVLKKQERTAGGEE